MKQQQDKYFNRKKDDKLKMTFISEYNPLDRKALSGTIFKMYETIGKYYDVEWIECRKTVIGKIASKLGFLSNKTIGHNYFFRLTKAGSNISYVIPDESVLDQYDVILCYFCLPVLHNIKTKKPVIYFSDAIMSVLIDYYPSYSNISDYHKKQIIKFETMAYRKTEAIVLSSEWAATAAMRIGVPDSKINILEFGANLKEEDSIITRPYSSGPLNVLFSGVDWNRKGGDIALSTVQILRNKYNIDARLSIVGIRNLPPECSNLPYCVNYGFLDKNKTEDYNKYIDLLNNSHLLLLPTKAECSAIVFCEAAKYGLPVFTYDTGGIGNYVLNGINGYRAPINENSGYFANIIHNSLASGMLPKLHQGALSLYHDRLNWGKWGEKFKGIVDKVVTNIKTNNK